MPSFQAKAPLSPTKARQNRLTKTIDGEVSKKKTRKPLSPKSPSASSLNQIPHHRKTKQQATLHQKIKTIKMENVPKYRGPAKPKPKQINIGDRSLTKKPTRNPSSIINIKKTKKHWDISNLKLKKKNNTNRISKKKMRKELIDLKSPKSPKSTSPITHILIVPCAKSKQQAAALIRRAKNAIRSAAREAKKMMDPMDFMYTPKEDYELKDLVSIYSSPPYQLFSSHCIYILYSISKDLFTHLGLRQKQQTNDPIRI